MVSSSLQSVVDYVHCKSCIINNILLAKNNVSDIYYIIMLDDESRHL